MSKEIEDRYWEHTSAADDGVEVVEQDANGDWIDSFNFDDYKADKGLSSTDSIWRRYGYSGSSLDMFGGRGSSYSKSPFVSTIGQSYGVDFTTAKKVESAQRLVQGFVDTFALDNPLKATFSDNQIALGGEEGAKSVVVSHHPLLDKTISEVEAHRIMTAQAANAAARSRFGGEGTRERQLQTIYALSGAEQKDVKLGNELALILDGYRIDSAFRRDYPGYEDVYDPAQAYIAKGLLKDREAFDLEDFAGASIANAALNYAPWTDWNGREGEREWWSDWAEAYAHGSVEDFVNGIVKGVAHIQDGLPPKPEPPKPPTPPKGDPKGDGEGGCQIGPPSGKGNDGDDKGDGEPGGDDTPGGDSPAGSDSEPGDDKGDGKGDGTGDDTDDGEGDPDDGKGQGGQVQLPTGLGEGVSLTGLANGQTQKMDGDVAEALASTAASLAIGRDEKEVGEVFWSTAGFRKMFGNHPYKPAPVSSANGYIRRAFQRSKTSHYASERGHLNGRIDNRSLPRIASDDYRLFSKRVAPSDTRYRVWLLVDNSGSMDGAPKRDAINLAASVALAVRHIPNVTLDVWAWTSGIKTQGAAFSAVRVYTEGQAIDKIGETMMLPSGGTPDNAVLSWAAREIKRQCRPDETPVLIMASDGSGGLWSEAYNKQPHILDQVRKNMSPEDFAAWSSKFGEDRVAAARKSGVKVLSVAIGQLDPGSQDAIYGKGNHLLWRGSIKNMAKPLGDLIARVASNRIK